MPGYEVTVFGLADETMHVILVLFSILVLTLSVFAYGRRREARYLLLTLAFLFLALSQSTTLVETLFLSNSLIVVPLLGFHLTHLFDFIMLVCFVMALTTRQNRGAD